MPRFGQKDLIEQGSALLPPENLNSTLKILKKNFILSKLKFSNIFQVAFEASLDVFQPIKLFQ